MGNCNVTGPNEVMVISGGCCANKQRMIIGGCGCSYWWCYNVKRMSLNVMTLEPKCESVETLQGVALTVTGVCQVMVMTEEKHYGDEEAAGENAVGRSTADVPLKRALEQFLGKSRREIQDTILQTLEGHLRAILGLMTVEDIYKEREEFASQVMQTAAPDLKRMGLEVLSFTIKDITDDVEYLSSLGKERIAEVKSSAAIGRAKAQRDQDIKVAECTRLEVEAKMEADSTTANNERQFETIRAGYQKEVNQRKQEADMAYSYQEKKTQQLIVAEEKEIEVVQRRRLIEVEEQEVLRKEKELIAQRARPAEAERYKIETLAEANRTVKVLSAQGEAAGIKLVGAAEAHTILAIGEAEAEAMKVRADAYKSYGDAAVVDMVCEAMPKIAAEIAAPLESTGNVILLSGQEGITGEVAKLMAELPPVVGALTGIDLNDAIMNTVGGGRARAQ